MYALAEAALISSVLSALTLGFPAATLAAPSGAGSTEDSTNELEHDNYGSAIHRAGTAPLDRCTVTAVRPAQVPSQKVHLAAKC